MVVLGLIFISSTRQFSKTIHLAWQRKSAASVICSLGDPRLVDLLNLRATLHLSSRCAGLGQRGQEKSEQERDNRNYDQ